jgi:periplasmic divalent cation tolerance protein
MKRGGFDLSEYVLVLCTTAHGEADKIARIIVEEKLAACVSIAPVRSCYVWEGEFKQDTEEQMIIKTTLEMVEQLSKRLLQLHSYEVPEIIVLPIREGHQPYLQWISESVKKTY